MRLLLLLIFVVLPLCELALLLWVAQQTHWSVPFGIVVGTGLLGVSVLSMQGWKTGITIRSSLAQGEPPTNALLDAGLLLLAAGMLMTPGLITDALGLSLALPFTRVFWRGLLRRRIEARVEGVRVQVFNAMGGEEMAGEEADAERGPNEATPPRVVEGRLEHDDPEEP